MGRPGISVSQQGVPVDRAADYQKTLDDRWPFLDIVFDSEVLVSTSFNTNGTNYQVFELCSHNLGYLPGFTVRELGTNYLKNGYGFPGDMVVYGTKNKIYLRTFWVSGTTPTANIAIRFSLRVFAVDITKEFRNDVGFIGPVAKKSSRRYGLRALDPNSGSARLSDNEMSKFSIHNNAKAFGIQQTGTRVSNSDNSFRVTIDHNLGYPPTYFIAQVRTPADWTSIFANPLPGEDYIEALNGRLVGISTSNSRTLVYRGAQAVLVGTFAFMILKDPVETAA